MSVQSRVTSRCDVALCGRKELHHFLPVLLPGMLPLFSIMTLRCWSTHVHSIFSIFQVSRPDHLVILGWYYALYHTCHGHLILALERPLTWCLSLAGCGTHSERQALSFQQRIASSKERRGKRAISPLEIFPQVWVTGKRRKKKILQRINYNFLKYTNRRQNRN